MNYREQQLRQLIKKNYIPLTDYQQETKELKKSQVQAQDLIDKLQKDLGINFLLDYKEIITKLKGRKVRDILQENETLEKDWKERFNELTDLNNQQAKESKEQIKKLKDYSQGYLKKIGDLETQLLNLAKQKIKGKKETERLLKEIETNWKEDKEQQTKTINQLQDELTTERKRTNSLRENLNQEQEKNKKLQEISKQKQEQFNEQLRKINLLFDEKDRDYTLPIDFNGLYALLVRFKDAVDRENKVKADEENKGWKTVSYKKKKK